MYFNIISFLYIDCIYFYLKITIILNIKTENMDLIELKEKEEEKRKEEERRANIARKNCK